MIWMAKLRKLFLYGKEESCTEEFASELYLRMTTTFRVEKEGKWSPEIMV